MLSIDCSGSCWNEDLLIGCVMLLEPIGGCERMLSLDDRLIGNEEIRVVFLIWINKIA
jgi:hypothetical protein